MIRRFIKKTLSNIAFKEVLTDPNSFQIARNYKRDIFKDPEAAHKMMVDELNNNIGAIKEISYKFDFPKLHVNIAGYDVTPIGTAAGMDNNGEMLDPYYYLTGVRTTGTVLLKPHSPSSTYQETQPVRVYVDEVHKNIYTAPELASKGLEYFLGKVKKYREEKREKPLLVSVSGIPPESDDVEGSLEQASNEFKQLVIEIKRYSNGFVWSPYSTNPALCSELKKPEIFSEYAKFLQHEVGKEKLKLVKMDPYDDNSKDRENWLNLVSSWIDSGGDGIVAVNPYVVQEDSALKAANWQYPSARVSGSYLKKYRMRAIKDAREEFPEAFIIATGGIDSGEEAWSSFEGGANAIEGLTSYYFLGTPLIIEMGNSVIQELEKNGYSTLKEYQKERFGF